MKFEKEMLTFCSKNAILILCAISVMPGVDAVFCECEIGFVTYLSLSPNIPWLFPVRFALLMHSTLTQNRVLKSG